jgi:hypothetical protein
MSDCPKADGFDPTLVGERHGLTCGYWTNRGDDLDRHAIESHGLDEDVYDLMDEQYEEDQRLREKANASDEG